MLYFANSVLCIEKELNEKTDNLIIGAFLPKYSDYYFKKIFDVKNSIFEVIVNALPGLFGADCKLDYYDDNVNPNYNSIKGDLQRSILAEVLTFPVETKKTFVEEYVLPQILTTILLSHKYDGVIFPSTKEFSEISNHHRFSGHDLNLGVFVKYDPKNDFDKSLQDSFFIFTLNGSEKFSLKPIDVQNKIAEACHKNIAETYNNNSFIIPLVKTKLHIEYLEKAVLNGLPYFETSEGKIELEFFFKLAEKMQALIK